MNEKLNVREREIVSTLLSFFGKNQKESDRENVSAVLSLVEEKEWTKYDFHNLNIAARYFERICEKTGVGEFVLLELEVSLPDSEQIILDYYSMNG